MKNLTLDNEIFWANIRNLPGLTQPSNAEIMASVDPTKPAHMNVYAANDAVQVGWTSSATYVQSQDLQHRLFFTVQKTRYTDLLTGVTSKNDATPMLYGGHTTNFHFLEKFNLNWNTYFVTSQRITTRSQLNLASTPYGPDYQTPFKLTMGLNLSYNLMKNIKAYIDARNVLNNKEREFAWADEAGGIYLVGLTGEF